MWEGIPNVTSFAQCNSEVEVRALLVRKKMFIFYAVLFWGSDFSIKKKKKKKKKLFNI